jgi:hypothetical protein
MRFVGEPKLDLPSPESSDFIWDLAPDVNRGPHERREQSLIFYLYPIVMNVAGGADGLNDVYEALESYNWDDDVEFQSGLSAILGTNSTPEQAAELTLRARCFYYAR